MLQIITARSQICAFISLTALASCELTNYSQANKEYLLNHENRDFRIDAVELISDEKLLIEIAKQDPDALVRLFAVKRITDKNILIEIAKQDESAHVRKAAAEKITDQNFEEEEW